MLYDVIDVSKHKTGITGTIEMMSTLPENNYFLVVRIWVKTFDNTLLLIQRLPSKSDALLWENPGTLVASGNYSVKEAINNLYNETGIIINKKDLIYYGDTIDGSCIVETYGCKIETPMIYLQDDKIQDALFIPISNIEESKDYITKNAWNNYKSNEKAINLL